MLDRHEISGFFFPRRSPSNSLSVFSNGFGLPCQYSSLSSDTFGQQMDRKGGGGFSIIESPRFGTDDTFNRAVATKVEHETQTDPSNTTIPTKERSSGMNALGEVSIHNSIRDRLDALHKKEMAASSYHDHWKHYSHHGDGTYKYAGLQYQPLDMGKPVRRAAEKIVRPQGLERRTGGKLGLPISSKQKSEQDFLLSSGAASTSAETTADELGGSSNVFNPAEVNEDKTISDEHDENHESKNESTELMSELRAIRSMMSKLMRVTTTPHNESTIVPTHFEPSENKGDAAQAYHETLGVSEDITSSMQLERTDTNLTAGQDIEHVHESNNQEGAVEGTRREILFKRGPQLPPKREERILASLMTNGDNDVDSLQSKTSSPSLTETTEAETTAEGKKIKQQEDSFLGMNEQPTITSELLVTEDDGEDNSSPTTDDDSNDTSNEEVGSENDDNVAPSETSDQKKQQKNERFGGKKIHLAREKLLDDRKTSRKSKDRDKVTKNPQLGKKKKKNNQEEITGRLVFQDMNKIADEMYFSQLLLPPHYGRHGPQSHCFQRKTMPLMNQLTKQPALISLNGKTFKLQPLCSPPTGKRSYNETTWCMGTTSNEDNNFGTSTMTEEEIVSMKSNITRLANRITTLQKEKEKIQMEMDEQRRIFVGEKELLLADVLEEKRKNGKLTKEVLEQKRIISSTKNEKEKIQHEMIRLENEHQNQKSLLIEDVTTFKSQRDELQDLLDAQEKHLKSTHHAIDQIKFDEAEAENAVDFERKTNKALSIGCRLESERRRLLTELTAVEKLYRDASEQLKEITPIKIGMNIDKERDMAEMAALKLKLDSITEEREQAVKKLEETNKKLESTLFDNEKLEIQVKALQAQVPDISDQEEKNQLLETLRQHRLQYGIQENELKDTRQHLLEAEKLNKTYERTAEELKSAAESLKKTQITLKAQIAASESREASLKRQIEVRRETAIADTREKRNLVQKLEEAEETIEQLEQQLETTKQETGEKEKRLDDKIRRLKLKVITLQEANQTLTADLEATLNASHALHRQVTELRSTGRLLNDAEVSIYQEKQCSNKRRSVAAVQKICVRGSNKKYRSEAVQVGKPLLGGLVWDVLDVDLAKSRQKNEEEGKNMIQQNKKSNAVDNVSSCGDDTNELKDSSDDLIFNSKTRPEVRKRKYRTDGRLLEKQPVKVENKGNKSDHPSSQKPTHAYQVRQMESQALIKAKIMKASAERQRPNRERKIPVLPAELVKEAARLKEIKMGPHISNKIDMTPRSSVFKLNRPSRKSSTSPIRDMEVSRRKLRKSELDFSNLHSEIPIDNAIEALKLTHDLREDFEKCKQNVRDGISQRDITVKSAMMSRTTEAGLLPDLKRSASLVEADGESSNDNSNDEQENCICIVSGEGRNSEQKKKQNGIARFDTTTTAGATVTPTTSPTSSLSAFEDEQNTANLAKDLSKQSKTPSHLLQVTTIDVHGGDSQHPGTPDFGSTSWRYHRKMEEDSSNENEGEEASMMLMRESETLNQKQSNGHGISNHQQQLPASGSTQLIIKNGRMELEALRRQLASDGVLTL